MRSSTSSSKKYGSVKRFIKTGCLFVLSWLVLLLGVDRLIAASFPTESTFKYADMYRPGATYPAIILGSSTLAFGLNPSALNNGPAPYYNFAFASGLPEFTLVLYRCFREQHSRPATVLLGADRYIFRAGMGRRIEQDMAYLPPMIGLKIALGPHVSLRDSLWNSLAILREKRAVEAWVTGQPRRFHVDLTRYNRGFAPLKTAAFFPAEKVALPHNPYREEAFRQLVLEIQQDGARVVFVQAPNHQPEARTLPNDDERIQAIAKEFNSPFLNYNGARRSALNDDKSAFADTDHLNERGAEIFSAMLSRDLAQLGLNAPTTAKR
ncbi:hypothetical protein D3C72_407780 [compost metagenome]